MRFEAGGELDGRLDYSFYGTNPTLHATGVEIKLPFLSLHLSAFAHSFFVINEPPLW